MRFLARFRRGEMPLSRIEAFSDGVFAIIVTLLVLELKVPHLESPGDSGELGHQLIKLAPKLLSWLISFVIVAKFWLNHHHVLSLARHADWSMIWLNSIFLMFQSFIPFPTALLGEYPSNPLAVSVFGIVMALNTVAFMALHGYILAYLIRPEVFERQVPRIILKSLVGPCFYLLGSLMAWIFIPLAFLVYMITPLFFIVPPERAPTLEFEV